MSKERNIETQKMLKAEGLYKGKLDGVIGPLTRRALELHNKQQYQPLPRQRPSGVSLKGGAGASGGPAPELSARGQVVPKMAALLPMPDSGVPAAPDFDALKAELASARVNPNPNRFGPELAGLGGPSPPPASFNAGMRATLGMPAVPPGANPLGMALRAKDEMDALDRRGGGGQGPVVPGQGGTGFAEALDNLRSWLADQNIIERPTPLGAVLSKAIR